VSARPPALLPELCQNSVRPIASSRRGHLAVAAA
jgi:hypothetical protein